MDYLLEMPIKVERGRMKVSAGDANQIYASAILEPVEGIPDAEQPFRIMQLPFVAGQDHVQVELSNAASSSSPLIHIESMRLYELGQARFLWLRYPRLLIHALQRVFLTAIILPVAIAGLIILIIQRKRSALVILSVVPLYIFSFQSIFHTEYRYVLAINYFLFAFAAVAVCWMGKMIVSKFRKASTGAMA
jgi:hypothetical protein